MSDHPHLNPLLLASVHILFKQKPSFLPIREHIENLRIYFPNPTATASKDLDHSKTRWTQFVEMKIKEEELRAEVSRLQSEVSRLGEGNALLGSAKSGGNGASAAMAPGSAKGRRRKKMQSAEKVLEEAWASLEEASVAGVRRGGDAGVGDPTTISFIRHMYHLQQTLNQADSPISDLTKSLIHPLDSAKKLLPLTADATGNPEGKTHLRLTAMDQDSIARVCHSLSITMTVVSSGFTRLLDRNTAPPQDLDKCTGVVVHALLSFFAFLRRRLSACIAELIRANTPAAPRPAPSPAPGAKAKPTPQPMTTRCETLSSNLTSLLAHFVRLFLLQPPSEPGDLENPETRNKAYESLAQGTLHQLLTRCGGLLHILTFDEKETHRPAVGNAFPERPSDDELSVARMEAKLLSPLLRYALRSPAVSASRDRPDRLGSMRGKMQATLMRGCFGDESMEELGEVLELGLAREDYNELLGEAEARDRGEGEGEWWFLREMWEVVGWEVLVPAGVYDE